MFSIYGGALNIGSIFQDIYNASVLATNDVVVVSVNYRVGPLGFLYGGDETAPGNVDFYDQLLALKWVRDNIHAFGGDRDEITIFGESAGSWSVSAHILSPLSKGLFKRAIMESGALMFNKDRPALISGSLAANIGLQVKAIRSEYLVPEVTLETKCQFSEPNVNAESRPNLGSIVVFDISSANTKRPKEKSFPYVDKYRRSEMKGLIGLFVEVLAPIHVGCNLSPLCRYPHEVRRQRCVELNRRDAELNCNGLADSVRHSSVEF
ncbi:unnamed protein product [Oppiella nova]|uniref:Carboxylic ester hydrolase n=1 Tax=Oppiella nova TaxID=334625 RepID=A0A7R9M611_9ACAR|nr:unnamed protein product [Oppiella nova]CAG2171427.1 unnamed protein product [Oppiella nova]